MIEKLTSKLNPQIIVEAKDLLDSVSDTALIGAGTNPDARRLIVFGSMLIGTGMVGILLSGGLAAFQAGAGVSVLTGVFSLFRGLFIGYKSGRKLYNSRDQLLDTLNQKLEKSDQDTTKIINLLKGILIIPVLNLGN